MLLVVATAIAVCEHLIEAIVVRSILTTPVLEIGYEIVSSGRVLSPSKIRELLPAAFAPPEMPPTAPISAHTA
ncbi:MAG: hypothetical protein IJR99_01425 [Kiritimatiellae bacterium]|nr:hypothetical protein [Kiritimatiellia bacterium]